MKDCTISDKLSEQEIPRHKPENFYNYTELQLSERRQTLKAMHRDFPNLPWAWLEMVYDVEKNTPKEEIDEIINKKMWEGPGKFTPGAFCSGKEQSEEEIL